MNLTQSHIDIIGTIAFGLFLLVMGFMFDPGRTEYTATQWQPVQQALMTDEEMCQIWNKRRFGDCPNQKPLRVYL